VARRLVVVWTVLAGCYAPSIQEGVPCAADRSCPIGLSCDANDRCVRDPIDPVDGPLVSDAAIDAPIDAPTDAPPVDPTLLVDDFDRPDAEAINNGWIEKTPAAFTLVDGRAKKQLTTTSDYRDNLVYRPASENLANVEIAVDVTFTATPPGYAQIFVRARSATITASNSYDGYLLYVVGDSPGQVTLGRQLGTVFVETLSSFSVSPAFVANQRYRLTLRAVGKSPVKLSARVERVDASGVTLVGQTSAEDADPRRIQDAGTVGFSGSDEATYAYERFHRIGL
jgi:hypothetical protein